MRAAVLFNNSGALGDVGAAADATFAKLRAANDLNITSAQWLTVRFLLTLRDARGGGGGSAARMAPDAPAFIVNVSSLAAVLALPTWGVYCAGKAARDMFTSCVAEEALPVCAVVILHVCACAFPACVCARVR